MPHKKVGKFVVATSREEHGKLLALFKRGQENGVPELELLDARAAQRLEPSLQCWAALHSPVTGIIDSHRYCSAACPATLFLSCPAEPVVQRCQDKGQDFGCAKSFERQSFTLQGLLVGADLL